MTRDELDTVIVVGGLILLGMSTTKLQVPWGDPSGWHFPVPDLRIASNGEIYHAVVSQEFKPDTHRGVDIMYRRHFDGDRPEFPAGVPDAQGAKQHRVFFAPIDTPILAARAGRIWSVQPTPRGWAVVIDHGKPWATFYHHIQVPAFPQRTPGPGGPEVARGQVIGTMGYAPDDAEKLRHLHFEAWLNGGDFRAGQDPGDVMTTWERGEWTL